MQHQSPVTNHQSLLAILREGIARLESEHIPSAPLAAELLLMLTIGRDRTWLYAHPEQQLDAATRERYFSLITQRVNGVPTQHLTGHQEFWGLDFEVTPDVLIPRPETEHVIEVALERLGVVSGDASQRDILLRIADVGTGSGCIAVALAHELPGSQVTATDISPAALEVARRNAVRNKVLMRIEFMECNLLDALFQQPSIASSQDKPVASHQSRLLDLIVSNPPYIGRAEAATLAREVREHEPEIALFGGEAGTEMYAPLIVQAAALLKTGGIVVLELGLKSAGHVSKLLDSPEWSDVTLTNDLAGIKRVASARRTASTKPS